MPVVRWVTLSGSFFSRLPDYAGHTILPALTLILVTYTSWAIYQRASMIETLDADHVRLARAKGLSRRRVLIRHVLRNALIPLTTVVALDFAAVPGDPAAELEFEEVPFDHPLWVVY